MKYQLFKEKAVRQDNAHKKRVELYVHTNMSAGVSSAITLISSAAEFGHTAIAITDKNVVQAFPEAARASEKLGSVKILYGLDCCLEGQPECTCPPHIIILAKNRTGLKNLYRLVSWLHLENTKSGTPQCLTREKLSELRDGLIVGSTGVSNKVCEPCCVETPDFYDFLGITPYMRKEEVCEIVRLGEKYGIRVCAVGNVHYCDPEDEIYLKMIEEDQGLNDPRSFSFHLHTTEEMLAAFSYLGKEKAYEVVVTNTNRIADEIEVLYPIPKGMHRPKIDGSEEELTECVYQCAKSNYGDPIPDFVKDRIGEELKSIILNGFAVNYIIAKRLIDHAKEYGCPVSSWGSTGSSLVAHLSGITNVNPLPPHYICPSCHHAEKANIAVDSGYDLPEKLCPICGKEMRREGQNIPFETFAGLNGEKEPYIDLVFPRSYRDKVKEYLRTMFSKAYTVHGGIIYKMLRRANGIIERYEDRHHLRLSNKEIDLVAQKLEGKKRCTDAHLGGIMLIPDGYDAEDFSPLQYADEDTEIGSVITQFDFHDLHGVILKVGVLGRTNVEKVKLLEEYTGIRASDIPMNDPAVYSLFRSPEALGIKAGEICFFTGALSLPEFSTEFMEHMLRVCRPKNFSELVKLNGMAHGTGTWRCNAEILIIKGTAALREVIAACDDIMLDLIKHGIDRTTAFEIGEIIRKGKAETELTPQHIQTMLEHHIPQWYIDSMKKIEYLYPKAHAVENVRSAVILAWYKLYYPQAYYRAYFETEREHISEEDLAVVKSGNASVFYNLKMSETETPAQELCVAYEAACRGLDVSKLV